MIKKRIVFAISQMNGGGAEHVIIQLANYMLSQNIETEILITNQKLEAVDRVGLRDEIKIVSLDDTLQRSSGFSLYRKITGAVCRCLEKLRLPLPDGLIERSFQNMYGKHVAAAVACLNKNPCASVVAFLPPANEIMMMACKETGNRLIVSERGDPNRFFKTRYAPYFMKHYYPNLAWTVFQTLDAQAAYPPEVQEKSSIILNPIPNNLPERYSGCRQKKIVNFCRLTPQKNLFLLLDAFEMFWKEHPDYKLEIYGDGELKMELLAYAKRKKCTDAICIYPHKQRLHESIRDYMMFVSSSDWEGMSNSMLEAMAIGLPVICTDCPIGGAKTVIRDGENGLIVPMKDCEKLAEAMCKIAGDTYLANQLSENAAKIYKEQNLETIGKKWMEYIWPA